MKPRFESPLMRIAHPDPHAEVSKALKKENARGGSVSSANKRGESIDYDKYKPITRHAESHRQLGVTGGSRTNLFEQALRIGHLTRQANADKFCCWGKTRSVAIYIQAD